VCSERRRYTLLYKIGIRWVSISADASSIIRVVRGRISPPPRLEAPAPAPRKATIPGLTKQYFDDGGLDAVGKFTTLADPGVQPVMDVD
jgi:hypothetical protein